MDESLEELLKRLARDQALFQGSEEATKLGAILPVLHKLGWNRDDPREVTPEYSVGNGRVDFCLHLAQKKVVYIEVKRWPEELAPHEEQLLLYAFRDTIPLAILTNGLVWWFYLPQSEGSWQQRRFFTIDIQEQSPESAAKHFREFLGRDAISTGAALTAARSIHQSREKDRLIKQALPKAWHQLFVEPDELLIDLMAEKVESLCGHRPDPQAVADFMRSQFSGAQPSGDHPDVGISKDTHIPPRGRNPIPRGPRQHGATVKINGVTFKAVYVRDLYEQVLKYLCDNGYMKRLEPILPYATSRKRYLLAGRPTHPGGKGFVVPVEYKGYYLEAHKDYRNAIRHLQDMLKKVGLVLESTTI